MDYRLLGPLSLRGDNGAGVLSAAKQRQLLALLLLHANQTVPFTSIVREVWTGDHRGAAAVFGESLRIWRGPVLVDVPAGRLLEVHVARLTECQITVRQQLFEAQLNLGLHYEILGEVTALAAEHPLQENIH